MHIVQYHLNFGIKVAEQSYRMSPLSTEAAMEKMLHNGEKAILEHEKISSVFASAAEAIPSKKYLEREEKDRLNLKVFSASIIGCRPRMEDAHFIQQIEQGALMGVFDGHGGAEVADYASQEFRSRFSATLKEFNGDVFRAFEVLIHRIHLEVVKKPEWNLIGTTAVISFIDKKTHQIITASLADSEANLYRSGKSIPLTPVRCWSSKKDSQRLEKALGLKRGEIAKDIQAGFNPKSIRWNGVNISRAIGNHTRTGTKEMPCMIHKPKITINKVKEGDILVLACDGLKDFVPENEIVKIVENGLSFNPAEDLVNYAVNEKKGKDNVTVIAAKISYDRMGEESKRKKHKA
jgi:serine/threonine protein phosphatase PrpC